MKILFLFISVFIFSATCAGQKTAADLKSSHALVLEEFFSENKQYQFLSSKVIDAEYLEYMRESFGENFEPFYRTADFNSDKIIDFAVILSRTGQRKETGATSLEHKFAYPLAVVIFNGDKTGNFTKSFTEDIEAPLVCFLKVEGKKRKNLYFGVFESDADIRIFKAAGKGYISEFLEEPGKD